MRSPDQFLQAALSGAHHPLERTSPPWGTFHVELPGDSYPIEVLLQYAILEHCIQILGSRFEGFPIV